MCYYACAKNLTNSLWENVKSLKNCDKVYANEDLSVQVFKDID